MLGTEGLFSIAQRSSLTAPRLRTRLLEHVRMPLHRDGYALALNTAFTAATGLLYWILAAKTYSAHAVGVNSALISSMMFLAGIASLNLPNILVRFLPESGRRTVRRVILSYAAAMTLALCTAAVFIIWVGRWAPRLGFLHADRGLQEWFLFSTLAWCVFVIQDSVLTALGRAVWVPVENAVFSVLKLGLLAAVAASMPLYGIFVSWTIAMLVSVAAVNLIIFLRLMRPARGWASAAVLNIRDRAFARYFAADYICSVAWLSTTLLMPVVVTAAVGATTNAYWALAYAVALPFYAFAQNIGTALMLHGTNDRAALPTLARKAARQGARVLLPSVALLAVLAPYLLSLFGGKYPERSTTLLRLLALGALPNFVLVLAVSIARVQRRLRRAVIACCTEAALALSLATPLLHALGVVGAGIAWVGSQSLVAFGLLITWRGSLDGGRLDRPLMNAAVGGTSDDADESVPARAWSTEAGFSDANLHPVLRQLFTNLERRRLNWVLLRVPSNPAAPSGDVDLLVAPGDAETVRQLAAKLGFLALPGWESPPDLILVRYDRPSDRWLVLDVSTAIEFHCPPSWRLPGAAEQVLLRRRLHDGLAVPADADAFWLLVLHCLLDKQKVAMRHREGLARLAPAGLQSPLGPAVCAAAGAGITPAAFVDAARAREWEALMGLGGQLAAELKRRRPARERVRSLALRAARVARKPLLLPRRRGMSLALLGPNGVGKSTAAAGLQKSFPFESRVVYMGMWKGQLEPRVGGFKVTEILARPLRIWSYYLLAQYHQLQGRLVVFDRYVYDALLPAKPPLVAVKRPYFWFLAHTLPSAGTVIVLDVPGQVAYGRKQENPADELESERRMYAQLTSRVRSLELVDATADADTVRAEITTIVWRELAARWQGVQAVG